MLYEVITELEPDREDVRLHLAIILARTGDNAQAVEELKVLLQHTPA